MCKAGRCCLSIAILLLLATACSGLAGGESGHVAMMPFFRDEVGVRGVEPAKGWSDEAMLIQDRMPGTLEDMKAVVLEQTSLAEIPKSTRYYRGRSLDWQVYSAKAEVFDAGPQVLQIEFGLAEDETSAYVVALLAVPEHYRANTEMYQSIFTHAMYAFEPMP